MKTPKTELCCGLKPKRTFYQMAYRDDEGFWQLKCRKCDNKIKVENTFRGTSKAELEATIKWNELVLAARKGRENE